MTADTLWTEARVTTTRSPDEDLLLALAPGIEALRARARTWHFFWEPDLWLRFAWPDADARTVGEQALEAMLADRDLTWRWGAYGGEAEHFGEALWPLHERAFEVGSDMALAIVRGERDGTLARGRAFHWHRHVHTFSNRLVGTWAEEARLAVRQALYRARLLRRADAAAPMGAALDSLLAHLDGALERAASLADAEVAILAAWRAAGRPSLFETLRLDPDFHRDPGERS